MNLDQAKRIALALQAYDMIMFVLPQSAEGKFNSEEERLICTALNKEGYRLLQEAGFDKLTSPNDVVKAVMGDTGV